MADFSMYHALGEGEQDKQIRTDPAAPQFIPPVAPPPSGYAQGASPYAENIPTSSPQYQYGGVSPGPIQHQQLGAPAPGSVNLHEGTGAMGGLTNQMGGLGISAGTGGSVRPKKKDRHAYHDLGLAAGSSHGQQGAPQFLDPGLNQQPLRPVSPYAPQQQFQQPQSSSQAGFPGTGSGSVPTQGNSVDPEQIPSIPRSRDLPAQYYVDHVYPTMERHIPPPAAIHFLAQDQGISSPKFARLTVNNVPASGELLATTALPLGLILQPLARQEEEENKVPVLDFGDSGPPRCRRCRTYINPFMIFRSGGNKLVCNMCGFPDDVSPEYFAPLDPSGIRVDRMQRPELMLGTVEFVVPKEYWNKEPVGLRWLFVIDVTQEAVSRGFLEACCEGIMGALYGGEGKNEDEDSDAPRKNIPKGSKVGIVTYDKAVHFYNLSARLDQAQMIVMSDLEDPFVPLSEGLFVDPYESEHVISSLLTQIPTLFSQIKHPEPALLPALNAAFSALEATGGKMICSLGTLPTWGPDRLFLRDDGKHHGTDGERKLFAAENASWKKLASKMAGSGVGADLFISAGGGAYMDIATLGHVASVSGGETFFYPNWHAPRDVLKLSSEMIHAVRRRTGYQALLKVRCSNGLQVSSYHGNFLQHTFGSDLEMGAIDSDKAVGVIFSYDGKLDPKLDAHFQAALLYTTATGQRRVRCINVVAGVNDNGIETMKTIDQDAVVNIMAKEVVSKMADKSLKDIRNSLTEKTIDILANYRKHVSQSHPPGQLVLPEQMKEFSMYILSLLKCRAFKGGHEPSDRRVHDMRMLRSFGCTELSLYLYPRIIPIHNLQPEDGFPNKSGKLEVPPMLRASYSRIEEGGAYIVDNGQICLLWIHARVSPNLLEDLFGPGNTTLKSLDPSTSSLPVLDSRLNAQVRNILQFLGTVRGSKAITIQLARQGIDGAEYEFARLMVEDRNNEAQTYVDWLVHLHKQVQLEIGGHRSKDDGTSASAGMESTLSGLAGLRPPYW